MSIRLILDWIMEEKIRFKLRPFGLMNYLFTAAIVVFLYGFFRSYFLLLLIIIMSACLVISIAGVIIMGKNVTAELGIGKDRTVCGEETIMELRLQNPTWTAALKGEVRLSMSNTFLENGAEWTAQLPVKMRGKSMLRLPLRFEDIGRYIIGSDRLQVCDMLGIVCLEKRMNISCEVFALPPETADAEFPDISGLTDKAAQTDESSKKGSDHSEVSDIREYAAGDRLRDIHWKISARQGKLMVKERVSVAGSEMVILLNFVRNDELAQKILKLGIVYAKSFIRQRLAVCILCWNNADHCFEKYGCAADEELVRAYHDILKTPLSLRTGGDIYRYMANTFPYTDAYLDIGAHGGEAGALLYEK